MKEIIIQIEFKFSNEESFTKLYETLEKIPDVLSVDVFANTDKEIPSNDSSPENEEHVGKLMLIINAEADKTLDNSYILKVIKNLDLTVSEDSILRSFV